MVLRLKSVMPSLISPEQGAFVQSKSIVKNIFIAQEIMHSL